MGRGVVTSIVLLFLCISIFKACTRQSVSGSVATLSTQNYRLQEQVTKLKNENTKLSDELSELKANTQTSTEIITISADEDQTFSNILFWQDGKSYKLRESTLYADCFCSQVKTYSKILSPNFYEVKLQNGITVYAVLADNGIGWTSQKPHIES